MKKKHFVSITAILRKYYDKIPPENHKELSRFSSLIFLFCDYFKIASYKFDSKKFMELIYLEKRA
ncbi:MAG: hypothetical protein HQ536_02900 [Parcubacteria group bacterium]|nr:hypothetical protein [Parcubacteria group bacterium]